MSQLVYWSWPTMFLYLFQSVIGMVCMGMLVKNESINSTSKILRSPYTIVLVFVWTFFATFRMANGIIGGSDTMGYIYFFERCLNPNIAAEDHSALDPVFLWTNKLIRFCTNDYHWYFAFIYSFMTISYILFIKRFSSKDFVIIPYILAFLLFLRSYSSIRSNYSFCFVLLALVALSYKYRKTAYILAIMAALTHKGCVLYAFAVPFCDLFLNKQFRIRYAVMIFIPLLLLGTIARDYFIFYASSHDLGGSYGNYAESAKEEFDLNYVPLYGMYLLGILLVMLSKKIHFEIKQKDCNNKKFQILWLVVLFDLLALPVSMMFGNWRCNEFLYIPRLSMWALVLYVVSKKQIMPKLLLNMGTIIILVLWIIFRIQRTYEDTALMPYILDIF